MKYLVAFLLPALAGAAIWPDAIGAYHKTAAPVVTLADRAVWDEWGLAGKRFTATAWRLRDSTSALAAFDWQRNAKATPSKVAALAAETPTTLLMAHGNYLLWFDGYKPAVAELDAVAGELRNVDSTALPNLPGFLPSENRAPNSER
jgi:hypothetical protein